MGGGGSEEEEEEKKQKEKVEEVAGELLLVIGVAANEPCSLHFPIVITLLVISSL